MRPRIQSSAPQEEEEHPYELLLTAETKKLGTTDGRTEGMPTPLPQHRKECAAGTVRPPVLGLLQYPDSMPLNG